jgi:diguanylate cyclase
VDRAEILTLINNIALLLVTSVANEAINSLPLRFRRWQPWINGAVLSIICIVLMNIPFTLKPGLIYDTRSVLISVTGLVFGLIPTLMTLAAAIIFRISLGGIGAPAGIAVILSSAAIGLAWRRWVYPRTKKWRWGSALLMGIAVHIAMLVCTLLLLPYPDSIDVIRKIAFPVLVLYPAGSILLSMLLIRQEEYKGMRNQLEQSEERFKALFQKAPLGYQSLDFGGNFIEVNQQWLDMLGYTRDEVIGKWFGDFVTPEHREAFRERFPLFKEQGYIHSEFRMLHKNGTPIFIAFDGKIGYGADGNFLQTHCILQNVTLQKKMEDDLRASEEQYRRLFETMALGVVYQDKNGSIISVNPAAERILGRTFEQMKNETSLSPSWRTLFEDESVASGNDHPSMIALKTGKPCGPRVMGVYNPEILDHVWISIIATPLFHPGENEPYEVYTTFQDITAEHKANRNYYLLFQEMIDAYALHEMIYDPYGKPVDYRFLAVNSAFEHMTGLKAEDIIGKTVLEVLPETEQYWIETYGHVAMSGEAIRFENYTVTSDKYFLVSAYKPAPNQFACTFSDVTMRVRAENESQRIMSRMRALLDNSPSPIMIVDETGQFVEVSKEAERIMGSSGAKTDSPYAAGASMAMIAEKVKRVSRQSAQNDQVLKSLDVFKLAGNKRYFESRLFPIHTLSQDKRLFGYLALDVTERIAAEQALKESEERYSNYIKHSPYGVFVTDEKGRYVDVNPAASVISGYSREQLLQMSILDITAGEFIHTATQLFQLLKKTGSVNAELQYIHADGSIRWWTVSAAKLTEKLYLGFSTDITDKKNAEIELIYLGNRDFLTGLYNRRYFEMELKRIDAEKYLPLSIIMGDINGVKLVNDAFGHAEGDRLIVDSAAIMTSCCRPGDTLARIGGDEFGILLPNTDSTAALKVLANIQDAMKRFDEIELNDRFRHSISLGFGTKKSMDEDILKIVKIAEEYLYQRKLLEHSSSHSAIIASIKATMFEKSHETEEHAERLVILSKLVADGLHLDQGDRDRLELLATLHDIGKVGISDQILSKQGKLTAEEWVEMKRHPEIGYRIAMSSPELIAVAEGILCHQEHWDGTGYPRGLQREEIPLLSRIIGVVDAFDAMTQDRPYRSAMTDEEAIEEIEKNTGTQFDPVIARIFIKKYSEYRHGRLSKADAPEKGEN